MNKASIKLVNDSYFNKGHWKLKIRQTFVGIIGWCGVLFPLFWILSPLVCPSFAQQFKIAHYSDEVKLIEFLGLFFIGYSIFIVVFYFWITIWNNHNFAQTTLPDQEKVKKREQILESAWKNRFGSKEERYKAEFYSVSPEKNLDVHFTQRLFKEHTG